MMKFLPRGISFLFVFGLMLLAGMQRASAATPDSEQITQLLTDARSHALQAEGDAARLESYARSGLHWRTHAGQLESMKQHVNEMGKIAAQMQDLEPQGSPWQKQAIAQVRPLLRDMADNLSNTIRHLNDNQTQVHMPTYKDYTRTNYELAKRTADLIRDFIAYDEAKSTATSLEDKLELAQN